MASSTNFRITDFSNENSSFRVAGAAISSANYDAQQTAVIALSDAIEAIIIGQLAERRFTSSVAQPNTVAPTNAFAQRELKWLVTYSDDVTGDLQQAEIATPDLDQLVAGSDVMDTGTGTPGEDFVTAFEAFVKSAAGNAVSVISIRLVGRNI